MFLIHKQIGYDIMEYISNYLDSTCLESINTDDCYQKIEFKDKSSIKFTRWRNGAMPFYIILFDCRGKYIFELDLSMLTYDKDFFSWHLKSPTNKITFEVLKNKFGKQCPFPEGYVESIRIQKKMLDSGVNVPKNGFYFLENSKWINLAENLVELILAVFNAHGITHLKAKYVDEADDDSESQEKFSRRARKGQRQLRLNLLYLYNGACAITSCSTIEVLEVAHIDPHAESGNNNSTNALLLRADIHRLFDHGLLKIDPETLEIKIDESLRKTDYYFWNGKKLRERSDGNRPSTECLKKKWHG